MPIKMPSKTIQRLVLDFRPKTIIRVSNLCSRDGTRFLNTTSEPQLRPSANVKGSIRAAPKLKPAHSTLKKPTLHNNPPQISNPISISESVKELLPLLASQPSHYITLHIHGRPYLVTPGDTVRLPFKMPGVVPGNVLRLNRAANIGSRDYTLKGAPYIDERLFECRATVMGTESEPMRFKEKTKRRCRKVKTVKSKHRFTILRIAELKVKTLQEIEALPGS